jgi:glycosyltransferase involved in cell wall biosynthesis
MAGGTDAAGAGLTLCMVVRDEQERLADCLASARDLVDSIVIVDTGSTDATVGLATRLGARVIHHDFSPVDFAAARNRGLDDAPGRYVLVLDADETLTPGGAAAVRDCVAGGGDIGWIVTRRNLRPGEPDPAWVDHAVRLFPSRPQYRYRSRVHETIDQSILQGGGQVRRSAIEVDHHLAAEAVLRRKWHWYVGLLQQELASDPDDIDRLVFLMADYFKLGMLSQAARVAERIAQLSPGDFTAQFQAALCLAVEGADPGKAGAFLHAALALRPNDPEALRLATLLEPAG